MLPDKDFRVIVGRTNVADESEGKEFAVSNVLGYGAFDMATLSGDVALLRIDGTLPAHAGPLALAPSGYQLKRDAEVTEYGYGYQLEEYGDNKKPTIRIKSHFLRETLPGSYSAYANCDQGETLVVCFRNHEKSENADGDGGAPWVTRATKPFDVAVTSANEDFMKSDHLWGITTAAKIAATKIHDWLSGHADIPQGVVGSIYVAKATGETWLYEADGFLHPIRDHAVYTCLTHSGHHVRPGLDAFDIAEYPEDPPARAKCTSV